MSISRRQFFRGLVRQTEDQQRELQRRVFAVESFVRTNLLPYDFALNGEQTAEVLRAAVEGIEIDTDEDLLTPERRTQIGEIVEEKLQIWRDEYLKAEDVRREALPCVREFLSLEASPGDLHQLKLRFHVPYPAVLEEEIERQVQAWLSGLSNSRLASFDGAAIRDLVFSELRSWC